MRYIFAITGILILVMVIISGCRTQKASRAGSGAPIQASGPQIIIYQTARDYSQNVPVILSDDKATIESYPGIKDVFYEGKLSYPTPLHKGFWLDNRGINRHVAFLSITYKEYAELPRTPAPADLMKLMLDNDPLVKMYKVGMRINTENLVEMLNKRIDSDNFEGFEKLK